MKFSVFEENELTKTGAKKHYDIFSNCHTHNAPKWMPHVHSYYELMLVLEGEVLYIVEDSQPIMIHEGDVIFIPPHVVHDTTLPFEEKTSCRFRSIVVKFSPLFLYPMETTQSDIDSLLIAPAFNKKYYMFRREDPITPILSSMMQQILAEQDQRRTGYELAMRGELIRLYIHLVRNCSKAPKRPVSKPQSDEVAADMAQQLHQIMIYLKENYQYNVSMQEVADVCGMSYYHFSRFFKKITGKRFNEYLLEMRLNYAQKKLLQSPESISDIALECGFEYVSYFIQKFRDRYGITPKEFQRRYRIADPKEEEGKAKSKKKKAKVAAPKDDASKADGTPIAADAEATANNQSK